MKFVIATIFILGLALHASASLRRHKSAAKAMLDLSGTAGQDYMIYADCGSTKTELFLLGKDFKTHKKCKFSTQDVANYGEKGRLSNLYEGIYSDNALIKKPLGELQNNILVGNTNIRDYSDAVGLAYEQLMAKDFNGGGGKCGSLMVKATQKPIMVMQATAGARKELGTLIDRVFKADNGITLKANLVKIRTIVEQAITNGIQGKLNKIYGNADSSPISQVSIDIISGRFEGLFAFTSLASSLKATTGAIDSAIYYEIGGASAQIAFTCASVPTTRFKKSTSKTSGYVTLELGSAGKKHVFSHSFLGTGQNELFRQIFQFNGKNGKSSCYSNFNADVQNLITKTGYVLNEKTQVEANAGAQFDACAAEIDTIFADKSDDISQGGNTIRKWSEQFDFIKTALIHCGKSTGLTLYVNNRMNLGANDGQLTLDAMKAGASSATPIQKSCGIQTLADWEADTKNDAGLPSTKWKLSPTEPLFGSLEEFMARTCFLFANVWEVAKFMELDTATTKIKEANQLAAWTEGGAEIYSTIKLKDSAGKAISDLKQTAKILSGPNSGSGGIAEWDPFDPNASEKPNLDLTANNRRHRMKKSRKHRN